MILIQTCGFLPPLSWLAFLAGKSSVKTARLRMLSQYYSYLREKNSVDRIDEYPATLVAANEVGNSALK